VQEVPEDDVNVFITAVGDDVDAQQQQQQISTPLSAVSRGSSTTPKSKRSSIKRLEEVATCVPRVAAVSHPCGLV